MKQKQIVARLEQLKEWVINNDNAFAMTEEIKRDYVYKTLQRMTIELDILIKDIKDRRVV